MVCPGCPAPHPIIPKAFRDSLIEKLLGNLIGLGRLMHFVARETGLKVGALTVVSTHAEIDRPGSARRSDIAAMIAKFDQAGAPLVA
jgi:hypothetical protein